jgi:hypothetical protein
VEEEVTEEQVTEAQLEVVEEIVERVTDHQPEEAIAVRVVRDHRSEAVETVVATSEESEVAVEATSEETEVAVAATSEESEEAVEATSEETEAEFVEEYGEADVLQTEVEDGEVTGVHGMEVCYSCVFCSFALHVRHYTLDSVLPVKCDPQTKQSARAVTLHGLILLIDYA